MNVIGQRACRPFTRLDDSVSGMFVLINMTQKKNKIIKNLNLEHLVFVQRDSFIFTNITNADRVKVI
jgi:hypothetical protein